MGYMVRTITNYWFVRRSSYLPAGSVIMPKDVISGDYIFGYVDGEPTMTKPIAIKLENSATTDDGEMYLLGRYDDEYEELDRACKEGIIVATDWYICDKNRKTFWHHDQNKVCPCYKFTARIMSRLFGRISGEIIDQYGNHLVLRTSKGTKDVLVIWHNMSRRQYKRIKKDNGLLLNTQYPEESFGSKTRPIIIQKSHG